LLNVLLPLFMCRFVVTFLHALNRHAGYNFPRSMQRLMHCLTIHHPSCQPGPLSNHIRSRHVEDRLPYYHTLAVERLQVSSSKKYFMQRPKACKFCGRVSVKSACSLSHSLELSVELPLFFAQVGCSVAKQDLSSLHTVGRLVQDIHLQFSQLTDRLLEHRTQVLHRHL